MNPIARLSRLARLLLCSMAWAILSAPSPGLAADYLSLLPSTRWISLSSPLFPTDPAECNALQREFAEETARLSEQHYICLEQAPSEEPGAGGCSKQSCEPLHTMRERAQKKSSAELSTCRERVNEHLAKAREQARRRQQAEAEAEREERERRARRDRDEAERNRRESDRAQRDQARKDRDAQRERERIEEERRNAAEREREARARADREAADRSRWRREAELAASQAREAEARRERDAKAQNLYLDLVSKLKETKDTLSTAIDFARNPFAKTLEMASDRLNESLLDAAIDTHAHIGPEKSDPRYDAIAAATGEARSFALGGNPFAEKISGLAMSGVQKIHRETLGQLDAVAGQIENFGSESAAVSSAPAPLPPSTPSRASDGGNPFARSATTTANDTDVSSPTVSGAGAPSTVGRPVDAATISHYEVPAGHTFYRAPGSTDLVIVQESQARPVAEDDRYVNGVLRCSRDGRGRVIAKCEERRRTANPFARKASQ